MSEYLAQEEDAVPARLLRRAEHERIRLAITRTLRVYGECSIRQLATFTSMPRHKLLTPLNQLRDAGEVAYAGERTYRLAGGSDV